jgi:hypothetical protein
VTVLLLSKQGGRAIAVPQQPRTRSARDVPFSDAKPRGGWVARMIANGNGAMPIDDG